MTAVDSSVSPKQQFILASPDGTGTGKVILATPESSNTKQLIFTTADSIVPGRIQVNIAVEEKLIFYPYAKGIKCRIIQIKSFILRDDIAKDCKIS